MTLTQITEKGIKDGEILNADINASAAIARTKLANVDLVDDTSPQLGGNLDTNDHHILVDDNHYVYYGDGEDLKIGHDGTNSYLQNTTGVLYINNTTGSASKLIVKAHNNIELQPANGETGVKAIADGAVELYHNNTKKFETTSYGARVYGNLENHDDFITVKDGGKFTAGNSDDLQIYHQGTVSRIQDVGVGGLEITSDGTGVDINKGTSEYMARFKTDDAVELYYDNSKKLETSANGVKIESGTANLEVYSSTDDEEAKITIIGKTASGGVGQAGRVEIAAESTNNSNGSSSMHLRTRKTNNTVTTALTINDEQKVSIGNTSPQQLLHVWPDAANTTSSYVRVTAGDRGSGTGLDLGHDSSGNCHVNAVSNAHLIFSSNNTERMRVLNGGGLTFNGDTSSDNALDDYEEGTFSPSFKATGATNNSSTTVQESRYIKIGGLVFVSMFIDMNSHGNNTGGDVNITGLPYTASGRHYPVTVGYFNNLLQNQSILTGTVQPGTSLILLRHATGFASALGGFDYSNAIGTSTEMIVSAVYCSV